MYWFDLHTTILTRSSLKHESGYSWTKCGLRPGIKTLQNLCSIILFVWLDAILKEGNWVSHHFRDFASLPCRQNENSYLGHSKFLYYNTTLLQMMTHQYCWKLKTWDVPGHKVPATDYLHPESPFPHHLSHPWVSQRMRGFRLGHLLSLSELIHWWSCCNSSVWFMEVLHTSPEELCVLYSESERNPQLSPLSTF